MKRNRRPLPDDEQSREVLRAIYRPGGVATDLRRLERRPDRSRRRRLFFLLGFLLVAGATALVGMSVFSSQKGKFSTDQVDVTFDGPSQTVTGDDYIFTVSVQNNGAVRLEKTELTVRYPDGFQFVSATPQASNEFSNAWTLGSFRAGETKRVRIVGRLLGELGSAKAFLATASYEPANFASQFNTEASFSTSITTASLQLAVKAPHAITSGQDVTYELTVSNTSDNSINRIRLEATFPEGLAGVTAKPAASENENLWDFPELKKGEAITIKIAGKLSGTPGSVSEMKMKVGVLDNASFVVQRETSALVLILKPTLNLSVTSGDAAGGHAVNPRDTVNIQIRYSNDSDSDFSGATLLLTFDGKDSDGVSVGVVDLDKVSSGTAFVKSQNEAKISWTKDEVKAFDHLIPGTQGSIDVKLPVKSNVRSLGSGMNLAFAVQATISVAKVGNDGGPFSAASETLTFPVTTEIRLAADGRYYSDEGAPVGSGPLPPQAGLTTTYAVSWFVTNTLNGANGVLLKTKLPDAVSFVDAESTGGNTITFDETLHEVRWRIAKVDARVGQTLPTLVGTFRVSIAPTDADVGKVLDLVGASTLTGTDAFSGAALSGKAGGITTDLANDPLAAGKGAVVTAEPDSNANTNSGT